MSLLWVEGFETYGITSTPSPAYVMGRKYATYNNETFDNIITGRNGYGYHLDTGSAFLRTPNLNTDRTLIAGAAINISYISGAGYIIGFYQSISRGFSIYHDGSGELAVKLGTTTLATTSGLGLTGASWYFIELKAYCDDSLGTYEVRVNGVNVLSATGVDTRISTSLNYYTSVQVGAGAALIKIDDWYVCNGAGGANNDFIGDCVVETIYPDSDSSITWTPDSGVTNYTQVNASVVVDADYVEATTGKDLYGYSSLVTTNLIHGLMINTDAELTDATARNLKVVVSSSSVESTETFQTLGKGASSFVSISEEDPNTTAAWLYGGVNSAVFGVEVA